jgi:hypothetical protein
LCCTAVTGEILYDFSTEILGDGLFGMYQIFYPEFLDIGCSCYYGYSAGYLAGIILNTIGFLVRLDFMT